MPRKRVSDATYRTAVASVMKQTTLQMSIWNSKRDYKLLFTISINMGRFNGYKLTRQPNILPPLFNRKEQEVQQFNEIYGKDYKEAVRGIYSHKLAGNK